MKRILCLIAVLLTAFSLLLSQTASLPGSSIQYFLRYADRCSNGGINFSNIEVDRRLVVTVKTQNTYYSLTRTPNRVIVGNITVAASVMLGLNMTLQLLSGKNIQEAFDNSVPDTVKYLGASFAGLAMKSLPVISRLASSASQALWGSVFSVVAFTVFDISFRLFSGDSVGEVFTDPSFYVKTLSYLGLALTSYFLSGPVVAIVAVGVTLLLAFLPNSENNRIQKAHEEYALKSIDLDLQVAESILSPAFH